MKILSSVLYRVSRYDISDTKFIHALQFKIVCWQQLNCGAKHLGPIHIMFL